MSAEFYHKINSCSQP